MGIADTAAQVFRDFVVDGVPSSGIYNPEKADIRSLFEDVEAADFAGTFVALTDTPANYTGAANKFVRVNSGGTAIIFDTIPGSAVVDFIDLGDTPSDYTGDANKLLAVKAAEDGVELIDAKTAGRLALVTDSGAISGASSVAFTLDFTTYAEYEFVFENVRPTADNVSCVIEYSTNSGSTYLSTNTYADARVVGQSPSTVTGAGNVNANGNSPIAAATSNSSGHAGVGGSVKAVGAGGANQTKLTWHLYYIVSGGASVASVSGGGSNTTAAAITNVRFSFPTTTIAAGRISSWAKKR